MWTNGYARWKENAVMPLMSKHAALYSRSTPYFTVLSRVESCPALRQYLFAVTIAKSGANACTKCPTITILHHSFPTSSYSSRTWLGTALAIFRNGWYRRFRYRVHCRRVRSFLPVLFRCSLRRNSSRYTLDRLAAIWARIPFYLRSRSWILPFR